MRFFLLTSLLLAQTLSATTLETIIESSLNKSPSLESINAKIQANKEDVTLAKQFANPDLLLTKNTLPSSQAMSQTVLTFKQKIPYFSKREKRQNIAIAEEKVLQEKLHSAKVALVALIKKEAYTIWELKELKKIIKEYIHLTQRNVELYESYVSTTSNQHMGIMKAKLSLSELRIKISILNAKIASSYARLSYLASFEVDSLEIALSIGEKPNLTRLSQSLVHNPKLALKEKELLKQQARISLADINKYPDFMVVAGLSYRENFDNYANLGVGITLPIYGTEDAKSQKARAEALSIKSQEADVKISIDATLKAYYAQMQSSYEIYHIVQDEALPQVAHMFELSNSSIATGGDLFKYIDVLFQRLNLEQRSIIATSNYNKAQAKISELAGALK